MVFVILDKNVLILIAYEYSAGSFSKGLFANTPYLIQEYLTILPITNANNIIVRDCLLNTFLKGILCNLLKI
jgi:hypothetical protein